MGWATAFAISTTVAAVTLSVVVLIAIGFLRRTLNEGALRQAQQMKRLIETIAVLHQQQQSAQAKIQVLVEANRKMAEDLSALGERVGESEGPLGTSRVPRLLH